MDDDFDNLSHHDQQMRFLMTITKELAAIRMWQNVILGLTAAMLGKLFFS